MRIQRPLFGFIFLLMGLVLTFSSAEAKLKISCIDSDGGLNLTHNGEVTVTASHGDSVLMQRTFSDTNWLGQKKYVEFYCDGAAQFPLYKLIDCNSNEATSLPSGACPSAEKGSIMLEARHASEQPKAIVASSSEFLPYYNISLAAPVDDVFVKSIRFNLHLGGLVQGENAAIMVTEAGQTTALNNTMLAWDNGNYSHATVILQLDHPLKINMGTSKILTLWLQDLVETAPNIQSDNQISVSVESIELNSYTKIYVESKAQINSFES